MRFNRLGCRSVRKPLQAQLQEVSGKVSECEKEEVAARSERGSLAEQLNRESELGKERLQLQEKSTKDQVDEVGVGVKGIEGIWAERQK